MPYHQAKGGGRVGAGDKGAGDEQRRRNNGSNVKWGSEGMGAAQNKEEGQGEERDGQGEQRDKHREQETHRTGGGGWSQKTEEEEI